MLIFTKKNVNININVNIYKEKLLQRKTSHSHVFLLTGMMGIYH